MQLRPTGYGRAWAWMSLGVTPLLLALIHLTIGLRPEHFVFTAFFLGLAWAGPRARRFSALTAPFVLTGLAYDFLRLFLHFRPEIHVGDLFEAERAIFGVGTAAGRVAISDIISAEIHPALDLACGLTYILYLIQVFAMGAYLYFRDEERMQRLAWSFTVASALGWITWLVWPAAPPWYVDLYGTGPAVLAAVPSPAGAARFDALLGVSLFSSFYARSANVFGAMPSLHVGYALLPALATWSLGGRLRWLTAGWVALMAFAAVYLRHHYVLDVVGGMVVAVIADGGVRAAQHALAGREAHPNGASIEVST